MPRDEAQHIREAHHARHHRPARRTARGIGADEVIQRIMKRNTDPRLRRGIGDARRGVGRCRPCTVLTLPLF
jgi:hypothetical protein